MFYQCVDCGREDEEILQRKLTDDKYLCDECYKLRLERLAGDLNRRENIQGFNLEHNCDICSEAIKSVDAWHSKRGIHHIKCAALKYSEERKDILVSPFVSDVEKEETRGIIKCAMCGEVVNNRAEHVLRGSPRGTLASHLDCAVKAGWVTLTNLDGNEKRCTPTPLTEIINKSPPPATPDPPMKGFEDLWVESKETDKIICSACPEPLDLEGPYVKYRHPNGNLSRMHETCAVNVGVIRDEKNEPEEIELRVVPDHVAAALMELRFWQKCQGHPEGSMCHRDLELRKITYGFMDLLHRYPPTLGVHRVTGYDDEHEYECIHNISTSKLCKDCADQETKTK